MSTITDDFCPQCNENTAHSEDQVLDAIISKCVECGFERVESLDEYYEEEEK